LRRSLAAGALLSQRPVERVQLLQPQEQSVRKRLTVFLVR